MKDNLNENNNRIKVVNLYKEPYDVYIGRAGKGQPGYFGNPHKVGFCLLCKTEHKQSEAVKAFRIDFWKRLSTDNRFKEELHKIFERALQEDVALGCFCKPEECHGDVYSEYFNLWLLYHGQNQKLNL